jgi:endonuclease YncB( thermonuclease family)
VKRRNGTLLALALILGVSLLAGIPYLIAASDARRPSAETAVSQLELPDGMTIDKMQVARVEDVLDGDTADVLIDGRTYRVRYYGLDTPERGERCFREATDRNQQLVETGDRIYLLKDAREFDSANRLLRYVFLSDGTSVEATLVAEGYGQAWRQDGEFRDQIVALEAEAQSRGRGCLWAQE